MKNLIPLLGLLAAANCAASIISYKGTLATPESYFQTTATLSVAGTLTLQTYGFGGGTSAGGLVSAGGFDPLVAVFDSTGLVIQGTSDTLTNYSSFEGCPPAGLVTIGTVPNQCGDITMSLSLAAGTYTIVLSDAAYVPWALYDASPGNLSEGFSDLTGGYTPLQTCATSIDCNNDTSNWALDVTTPDTTAPATNAPEPGAMGIAGLGLLGLSLGSRFRSK